MCQENNSNEDNRHDVTSDNQQLAMQRKQSFDRLHGNGDAPHSGWNEHVSR